MMNPVHVKILRDGAKLPTYGTAGAAGADLYACVDAPVTIRPGETVFIPTGIALEVPEGCAGLVYARSGLACKRGLAPANKVGVVDSDYRGRDQRGSPQPRKRPPDHRKRRTRRPAPDHAGAAAGLRNCRDPDGYGQKCGRIRFHR